MMNKKIIWQDRPEDPTIIIYEDGIVGISEQHSYNDLFDNFKKLAKDYSKTDHGLRFAEWKYVNE